MTDKEPMWTDLLDTMYKKRMTADIEYIQENSNYVNATSADRMQKIAWLHLETGYSVEEIKKCIQYMSDVGLIEEHAVENTDLGDEGEAEEENTFGLSKKGFEVAHDRKMAEKQHEISERSTRISSYLVIAVGVQALGLATEQRGTYGILLSLIVLSIVLLVWIEIAEPVKWVSERL